MRANSLLAMLFGVFLLSACGGGADDNGGGSGTGDKVASDETPEIKEIKDPGSVTPAPCQGLLGNNIPGGAACSTLPIKTALCTIGGAIQPVKGAAELLFGPCDGTTTPPKPNLTVYVRVGTRMRTADLLSKPATFTTDQKIAAVTIFKSSTEGDPAGATKADIPKNSNKTTINPLQARNLIFEVVVEGAHKNPITVQYTTGKTSYGDIDDSGKLSAEAGKDFEATSGTLTFPANPDNTAVTRDIAPLPDSPVANLDPTDGTTPQKGDPGVRVKVLNDLVCESASADNPNVNGTELMGFRITYVKHTEPEDTTLPNKGAPQLIQKGAIGAITDDDCASPLQKLATLCGNPDTGKTLQLVGRTYAVLGSGQFASLTNLNEKRYHLTVNKVVGTGANNSKESDANPGNVAAGGASGSPLLFTSLVGSLQNDSPDTTDDFCSNLGMQAVSAVEGPIGPFDIKAGAVLTQLCAVRDPQNTGKMEDGTDDPNKTAADDPKNAVIRFTNVTAQASLMGTVGGQQVGNSSITPNDTYLIPGLGTLVLNEQVVSGNAGPTSGKTYAARTVNLAHLTTSQGELIIGHNFVGMSCEAAPGTAFPDNVDVATPGGSGGGLPSKLCAPQGSPPPFAGNCIPP